MSYSHLNVCVPRVHLRFPRCVRCFVRSNLLVGPAESHSQGFWRSWRPGDHPSWRVQSQPDSPGGVIWSWRVQSQPDSPGGVIWSWAIFSTRAGGEISSLGEPRRLETMSRAHARVGSTLLHSFLVSTTACHASAIRSLQ